MAESRIKRQSFLLGSVIYSAFALFLLFSWHSKGINTVTGDEPHYLVISSGIVNHGSLEQTRPYTDEFENQEIYSHGLAPKGSLPKPENTHATKGPNGLFNVHNIGLPIALSIPFKLGGVIGAKLFMVFVGYLIVLVACRFAAQFSNNSRNILFAVIATTISAPLIPASNQIYPDLLAGLISLIGLYWLFTSTKKRRLSHEAIMATAIAFLPWLQIKFSATCLILLLAISARLYTQPRGALRVFQFFIIIGISSVALAAYNHYAFGKLSGPYQSGALELSKTSLMVLAGLHIDQNQGFILQNPVNLLGLIAVGLLYKKNRLFTLVWLLVFSSLIVPNALHPNWYGGGSFSGRFQWAAAITFIIPTIYGLLYIAEHKIKVFRIIIGCGICLQLYLFYQYSIGGAAIYNRGSETWAESYSIYYYPAHSWLPMLYNSEWAYNYWPNYAWIIACLALLGAGFSNNLAFVIKRFAIFCGLILLVPPAFLENNHDRELIFVASQLPSLTGKTIATSRSAQHGENEEGFLSFGPYVPLRAGQYEVSISYQSSAPSSEVVGWTDIYDASSGIQKSKTTIQGTSGRQEKITRIFTTDQRGEHLFEFRTHWNGLFNLQINSITLRKKAQILNL